MTIRATADPLSSSRRFIVKPWGHEVVVTEPELPYAGKLLHVQAGHRLSLQVHDVKTETLVLLSGSARLTLEVEGELLECEMAIGEGYTVPSGCRHRLSAESDCVVMEVSTPETGITYRLEDDYSRVDEVRP